MKKLQISLRQFATAPNLLKKLIELVINDCKKHLTVELAPVVSYSVATDTKPPTKFPGFLCTTWRKRVTIDKFWSGATDTSSTSWVENKPALKCWEM